MRLIPSSYLHHYDYYTTVCICSPQLCGKANVFNTSEEEQGVTPSAFFSRSTTGSFCTRDMSKTQCL